MPILVRTEIPDNITHLHSGKVRETYLLEGGCLLMISTDRISAYDVVLPGGIADKGVVLTQLSAFWFGLTAGIVENHLLGTAFEMQYWMNLEHARRSVLVRRAERIDVECIVRGYITGSAWEEYRRSGTVAGERMPAGLREGDRFPEPLFTPTTKAEEGHDAPITIAEMKDMVGSDETAHLAKKSVEVYEFAHRYAEERGILIADTKMEFGYIDGKICLIDELLTPDSSRFWDAERYAPGRSLPNLDKQFVREWLNQQGWNREPPAPELPPEIADRTRQRYLEAYEKLTGQPLIGTA